jgi:hypothetical protein
VKSPPQQNKHSPKGSRRGKGAAGTAGTRDGKVVLDERAQEQPTTRKIAQRTGQPTRRSGA